MKRFLLLAFFLLIVISGGVLWWSYRETPESVLLKAVESLRGTRSAQSFVLDVAVTDKKTGTTSGFTAAGSVDVSNLALAKALGVLRIGAKTAEDRDQVVDVVVTEAQLAVRPRDVGAEYRKYAQELAGSSTSTVFLAVERDGFLQKAGYAAAKSGAKDADLRALFPSLAAVILPMGPVVESEEGDRTLASVDFYLDRRALRPFLLAAMRAWKGSNLTSLEYGWIDRAEAELGLGTFRASVDRSSGRLAQLTGEWPLVDAQGRAVAQVRVSASFDGVNEPVAIQLPKDAKDVTAKALNKEEQFSFPASAGKAGYVAPTGTQMFPDEEASARIDAFSEYYDQVNRRGLNKRKPKR